MPFTKIFKVNRYFTSIFFKGIGIVQSKRIENLRKRIAHSFNEKLTWADGIFQHFVHIKLIFIIIWCSWFTLVVVKVFHSMASVHCACNSKTKKSHRNRETGKNTHTKPKERRKEKNHFEILMQIMSHVYSSFLWNFEF